MEFRSTYTGTGLVGMALAQAAQSAASSARHSRELANAQSLIDHMAGSYEAADEDYANLLAEMSIMRSRLALKDLELRQADHENMELTLEIRALKGLRSN